MTLSINHDAYVVLPAPPRDDYRPDVSGDVTVATREFFIEGQGRVRFGIEQCASCHAPVLVADPPVPTVFCTHCHLDQSLKGACQRDHD